MILVQGPHEVVNRVDLGPDGVSKMIVVQVSGPDGQRLAHVMGPDQAARLAADLTEATRPAVAS